MSLANLPSEILFILRDELHHADLVNWSSTCSLLRARLAPSIFRCIKITNNEAEAKQAQKTIEKYASYVQKLKLCATFPTEDLAELSDSDYETGGEPDRKWEELLPPTTRALLDFNDPTHPLHAIDSFAVVFQPDSPEDWACYTYGWFLSKADSPYTDDIIYHPLESLMSETWRIVSTNHRIKHLTIEKLPPHIAHWWMSEDFQAWSAQLESLDLSLKNDETAAGWETSVLACFHEYVRDLQEHISGAKSVTSFKFENHGVGALGLCGDFHDVPGPLQEDSMPVLRRLEMVNCFVHEELAGVIRGRAKTLEVLILRDCTAYLHEVRRPLSDLESDGEEEEDDNDDGHSGILGVGVSWKAFFWEIAQNEPVLHELHVINKIIPLVDDEMYTENYDPETADEPMKIKKAREVLKEPGKRLFSYATPNEKYGTRELEPWLNRKRLGYGYDLDAYDQLMEVVKANALKRRNRTET